MSRIRCVRFWSARWLRSHRELPTILRVWAVVPATMLLVIAGGFGLTLPPGPLCDEGMVLFMEGGCDWGVSNAFFYSKLGLLVTMNLVFVFGWLHRVRDWRGFLPHFSVLALLTLSNYSDEYCRHYYSHPNGSIGQMTAEAMAFGVLGVSILSRIRIRNAVGLTIALLAWNSFHIAVFYLALLVTNHWTWLHTAMVVVITLSSAATAVCAAERMRRNRSWPAV
jgi:hypothetical protein